jgi:hypothetical protein
VRPRRARGDQPDARGEGDHDRVEEQPELRHAEVELELERREPDQEAAGDPREPQPVEDLGAALMGAGPLGPPALALSAPSFREQDPDPERRQRRAADHEDVGRSPQRHVLAEQAVPDVVEGEARQGEDAAQEHQHPAERGVPPLEKLDRGARAPAGPEQDGSAAGQHDPYEPTEDEEVGRVRERAGVAPVVDVGGDVPVEAEARGDQRHGGDRRGQGDPARQPRDAADRGGRARERARAASPVGLAEGERAHREQGAHHGDGDQVLSRRASGRLAGASAAGASKSEAAPARTAATAERVAEVLSMSGSFSRWDRGARTAPLRP